MRSAPNSRTFFYLAIFLVSIGVVTEVIAKRHEASVAGMLAKAASGHSQLSAGLAERQGLLRNAREFHFAGLASVLLGGLFWGVAVYRHEQNLRSLRVVLITLFALYVLLQCMAV